MATGAIVEIWRRNSGMDIPVKFAVGEVPAVLHRNEEGNTVLQPIQDDQGNTIDLVVAGIDIRELGAIGGSGRLPGPVFCIKFEDSPIERYIPVAEVIDIAYVKKEQV